ncbi:hypothetical protein JW756_04850 [Candidatus Woesearchaeota archaeon]|nr:hypothetical protein [Candidatus Woesearchaeota archaeon]
MAVKGKEEFEEEEAGIKPSPKKNPSCIVCGTKAEFCMRGIPKNTYCRECAENYFGLLEYLDKL